MSKEDQRKSLAEWTKGSRASDLPEELYSKLDSEESKRTSSLVMQVLVVMGVLIVAYSVYWMISR